MKGIWRDANTFDTLHNVFLIFFNSKNVWQINITQGSNKSRETIPFLYFLDTSSNPTLIHLTQNENPEIKTGYYWMLKIENGILEAEGDMQGDGVYPKSKWITPTLMNSASFFKVDKVDTHAVDNNIQHKKWLNNQLKKLHNHSN